MMNWTGGQLQRHHNRSGLLTKTQKQNFAKSRLQKGTVVPPPSPFSNFPDIGFKGSSTRKKMRKQRQMEISQSRTVDCFDFASDRRGGLVLTHDCAGSRVTEKPASHLTGDQSSHSGSGLSEVKRQLLKEPDWAAVSVTRPLELAFTSVEEVERFGKRRKLNDRDRKRLVAANNNKSTFFEWPRHPQRSRNSSSVIDTIEEDILFEFNGRPVAQSNGSSGAVLNSMSSQPMLLDHEVSSIADQDLGKENLTATWITSLFPCSQ